MRRNIGVLVLAIWPCGAVLAQGSNPTEHRPWEFSFFGGGSFLGEMDFTSTAEEARAATLHYRKGYQAGVRIGQNLGESWGAELEYSFSSQRIRLTNAFAGATSLEFGHGIHRFSYDVLRYFAEPSARIRPFVFVGAGISVFHTRNSWKDRAALDGVELTDKTKFAFNWGGGVKYLLRDQLALRFELSDRVTGVPHYGLVPGFVPDGVLHNVIVNLGVTYQWGSR